PADVREEELQGVARARGLVGLVDDLLDLLLRLLLLERAVPDLEPDPLELPGELLDVDVGEFVLQGEGLELGRLDPAALLARLDHRPGALALEQFCELILRQRLLHTPSTVVPTFPLLRTV